MTSFLKKFQFANQKILEIFFLTAIILFSIIWLWHVYLPIFANPYDLENNSSDFDITNTIGDPVILEKIDKYHLFGELQAKQEVIIETNLELKLKGVFVDNDKGSAIVADITGKDKTYFVGQVLPGNAKLIKIEKDKVLIEHNGAVSTLHIFKKVN